MFRNLTSDNFILYAANNYISPHYIEDEFFDDLRRFKYIKGSIQKYHLKNSINDRLVLNNIIMSYNVFNIDACTRMLFFKIKPEQYSILKTFLIYLNYMPETVKLINGVDVISSDIEIHTELANLLRKI
jgi:hypothetical protein